MTVPVHLILQVVQVVAHAGASHAGHEAASRRAEMAAQLRALEIAAQREESQQKAALLSQLLEACMAAQSRPFDFAEGVFQATHGLLAQQQAALIEEKKEILRLEAETSSQDKRKLLYLRKRKSAISNELADISGKNLIMQKEALLFAQDHGRSFQLPALPGVY